VDVLSDGKEEEAVLSAGKGYRIMERKKAGLLPSAQAKEADGRPRGPALGVSVSAPGRSTVNRNAMTADRERLLANILRLRHTSGTVGLGHRWNHYWISKIVRWYRGFESHPLRQLML